MRYKFCTSLIISVIFIGCAQTPTIESRSFTISLNEAVLQTDRYDIKQRNLNAYSTIEAETITSNKIEFMKLYFKESQDPYFGNESVPKECLDKTRFSKPLSTPDGIWAFANIPVDSGWNIGCKNENRFALYIIKYCKEINKLFELWLIDRTGTNLNPKRFECEGKVVF